MSYASSLLLYITIQSVLDSLCVPAYLTSYQTSSI